MARAPGQAMAASLRANGSRERAPTVHAAKNVGSGNAAEFATYVVEKGKPLVTVAP